MDLIRTTDHIQSRPGLFNQNTAPRDLSKPITNLSEFKGSAQPRGRANAGHAPDQYAPNRLQSKDSLPPSLIARITNGVLVAQRSRLANQPASSRDTRTAEHYKASYVLEDRGGATAPGAELSLRPTGKAAGGMDLLGEYSKEELRQRLNSTRRNIREAQREQQRHRALAESASSAGERQIHESLAQSHRTTELELQRDYDAINWELEARSGRYGPGGGSRF